MHHGRFYHCPINEGELTLTDSETHHLAAVRRAQPGDTIELFDGTGALAQAVINNIKKNSVILHVRQIQVKSAPPRNKIIIAPSLAKAGRFDWLITKCTELGVDRICPIRFTRTVKLARGPQTAQRYQKLTIAAAQQSQRLFLPRIDPLRELPENLEILKKDYPQAQLLMGSLNPDAQALIQLPTQQNDWAAFVGPEGGLTDEEEKLLRNHGARAVRLTDNILRLETAAVAFAAILCSRRTANRKITPPP